MHRHNLPANHQKGFTLTELLASLAIIGIILTVVVYNHRKFDNDIELTNVAYRVAIAIRQAQVYGISVKQYGSSGTNFSVPYGVQFSVNNNSETEETEDPQKSFVFFGDELPANNPDGYYQSGDGCDGECIERITLGRGNIISKFCVIETVGGATQCIPGAGGAYNAIRSLDITFRRPKPDAIIKIHNNGGNVPQNLPAIKGAVICIASPQGRQKKVVVYDTGQISVEGSVAGDACDSSQETD